MMITTEPSSGGIRCHSSDLPRLNYFPQGTYLQVQTHGEEVLTSTYEHMNRGRDKPLSLGICGGLNENAPID